MQHYSGDGTETKGWVTTRQASRALNVIPRQVRNYTAAGDLEGRKVGKGVNERSLVSTSSVETLRQKRHSEGKFTVQHRGVAGDAEDVGRGHRENVVLIRELAARLEDVQYELGRAETRLELADQAKSRLQEALERERERADILEAELREVYELQTTEPRATSNMASEDGTYRGDDPGKPQEGTQQRSWLYRFFFGPN
jgi:hypothetical protein